MDEDLSDVSELSSPPASPIPPPDFYPSPPPSQEERQEDPRPPPAKRRRVALPKERTTQRIDLCKDSKVPREDQQPQIDLLVKTLRQHRKFVVIAGAGISTSAGSTCFCARASASAACFPFPYSQPPWAYPVGLT